MMESAPSIHIAITYEGKSVNVHLIFSEGQDDRAARDFYESLKKIYMEKDEFRAMIPGAPELKSMTPSHLGGQGHGR